MSTRCVKARLLLDVTSRTAADVVAANPGDPDDEEIVSFSGPADVPLFMTDCLKDMFDDHTADADFDYPSSIVIGKGGDLTLPSGIELCHIPAESVLAPEGNQEDMLGVEMAYMTIMFRLNTIEDTDLDISEQMMLRARYVLDSRVQARYQPILYPPTPWSGPLLPTAADTTLDPDWKVEVFWEKELKPENVGERLDLYRLQFRRRFGS